jgi:hypothetical protein
MPVLGTAGWIFFPAISRSTLQRFATLARFDDGRLNHIQMPPAWVTDRRCMPYCFRCLVLNDADVSAPRWKREWLDPTAEFCRVHHTLLENGAGVGVPAIKSLRCRTSGDKPLPGEMLVPGHRPAALAELTESISAPMDTASKINDLQQQ